jgi:hypothetical protein
VRAFGEEFVGDGGAGDAGSYDDVVESGGGEMWRAAMICDAMRRELPVGGYGVGVWETGEIGSAAHGGDFDLRSSGGKDLKCRDGELMKREKV